MEAGTAEQAAAGSTVEHDPRSPAAPTPAGSTIADLLPRAVASFGENVAIRHKQDGAWLDVTYAELGEIVREIALGLIDLGIQPGERVCILAGTRPEWTYADLAITAAGAVVVPIYQTNSPEECHWVISDSGACAIVCENAEQLAKVAAVRDRLPELRTVIAIDPDRMVLAPKRRTHPPTPTAADGGPAAARGDLPGAGARAGPRADAMARPGARAPPRRTHARGPLHLHLHLRHHGPPKGCVLSHGNYCAVVDMVRELGQIHDGRGRLPVPATRPRVRAADPAGGDRPRHDDRLLRGRRQADRRRAAGGQTDLPALGAADLREDLHARPRRDRGAAAGGARDARRRR